MVVTSLHCCDQRPQRNRKPWLFGKHIVGARMLRYHRFATCGEEMSYQIEKWSTIMKDHMPVSFGLYVNNEDQQIWCPRRYTGIEVIKARWPFWLLIYVVLHCLVQDVSASDMSLHDYSGSPDMTSSSFKCMRYCGILAVRDNAHTKFSINGLHQHHLD